MFSICASIKANRLNARTRHKSYRGHIKNARHGRYLKWPDWMLSKYNIVPLQQLWGSLEGWQLRGNELRINLGTYQDISESAEVQGDFRNLFGTWRSAARAGERTAANLARLFNPFHYAASQTYVFWSYNTSSTKLSQNRHSSLIFFLFCKIHFLSFYSHVLSEQRQVFRHYDTICS